MVSIRRILFSVFFLAAVYGDLSGKGEIPPPAAGKLLLQTDRQIYIAGENVFYKLYRVKEGETVTGGEFVYLVLRNEGSVMITHALVRMYGDRAWGNIYLPDTLSSGMYQLLAYTNVMRNEEIESFAAREIFVANRFDKSLDVIRQYTGRRKEKDTSSVVKEAKTSGVQTEGLLVTLGKNVYGGREKINMKIKYTGVGDTLAFVSVSVAEKPAFFLGEEKRPVEGARRASPPAQQAGPLARLPEYLPESRGYVLQGRVYDGKEKPAKGVFVRISVPDTLVNLDYAVTDSTGMFRLLLNDYYLGKKIILMPAGSPGKRIVPDDKYRIREPYRPAVVHFPENIRAYILRSQKIVGIQKIYQSRYVLPEQQDRMAQGIRPLVYSHPDLTILPQEYVPLRDLPEISKEIIPSLRIRKHQDKYEVRVYNKREKIFFPQDATVFLDGVPVEDPGQLMSLGSRDIRRIEVHEKLWYYGDVRFNGIVAVFSTDNALERYRFSPDVLTLQMEAPAASSGMIIPRYDDPQEANSRIPDLRQLLFWQPELILKEGREQILSFYSGDLTGDYIVRVAGLTAQGQKVKYVTCFSVRRNKNKRKLTENGRGNR